MTTTTTAAAIDPGHFRNVLGHFPSGVTIVTAALDGELAGMTCQSFFSVSLDPPLVDVLAGEKATSYPKIRQAGAFCINILAHDQDALCLGFSRSGADKWKDVSWHAGATGAPILDGVQAWIDCRLEAEHDAGDHYLTLGRVVDLQVTDTHPLLFYKGSFGKLHGVGG
jgi:3-hydroxy-9,10-secoandrosta-1,3,5(10)-triene-9,17-dione monooxygenase reductase component